MTRAYVIEPDLTSMRSARDAAARLEEAAGLARALDVEIVGEEVARLSAPRASTLFGAGKTETLGAALAAAEVDIAVIDHALTPIQQRNLEKAWKVKVLDRTALILEIFGARARTREGALQVELAHLEYQRSRLVRSWTHLERQRGGVGFMGGPGETQIEADRRQLAEKIVSLKRRLEKVARTRALHRAARERAPYPVVALVGYTNAGKSTLFNRLTEAEVLAKDMLFATLDPTMRAARTPIGREVVLSDTVGFISDLPTELVAAFRATLEEVRSADVIVHVRDIADPDTDAQRADVLTVLSALDLEQEALDQVIEARNKIDLLDPFERDAAANAAARCENAVCVSAQSGEGVEALMRLVERRLGASDRLIDATLAADAGAAAAWLHERGCVRDSELLDDGRRRLRLSMSPLDRGRYEKRFGPLEVAAVADDEESDALAAQ